MAPVLTFFLSIVFMGSVNAQDFGVPLSWRKFSNSRPLSERVSIAQAAIDAILPQLNTANAEFNALLVALIVACSVITPAQVSAGKHPSKTPSLAGTCEGKTMTGGVFWRPVSDDMGVNAVTTTLYITLSAYLAEITGDQKYTTAAIQSANWMRSLNINSNNLALDTVNAHDCSRSPASWLFTYNSGKLIEGLSVLAHVTGDSQWTSLMSNVLVAATKNAPWQGSDGIITEGSSPGSNNDGVGFKAIFIRGLHEAFERSSNNDLRILVHSYIDVQYNALLDLAANGNTYSSNWHGPSQSFTTWGQLAALDVMTSAINAN
ncbi:hypothetical protein ONZ45_g8340 [Pleurotus djamor]|nr:hypothetical protein ONZ45_g8340 [Pleurotus djamor]